jgi:hypothetical protein
MTVAADLNPVVLRKGLPWRFIRDTLVPNPFLEEDDLVLPFI